jgi:transposase
MSELCRLYGISRRIGHKWVQRYEKVGLSGLSDQRRVRRRQALQTSPEIVGAIRELRQKGTVQITV